MSGFVVAETSEGLLGAAALERYGTAGLLRSVVVASAARGLGTGSALVNRVLADAAASGLTDIYLLTTTAEAYFPKHGFERTAREDVPEAVLGSIEFREACPSSAVVMHRRLG